MHDPLSSFIYLFCKFYCALISLLKREPNAHVDFFPLFHFTLLHLTIGEQNKFLDSDNWNSGMFGALPNCPKHALSIRSFLNPERSKVGQRTSKASSLSLLSSCIFTRLLTPLSFVPGLRLAARLLVMLFLAFAYFAIVIVCACVCN